MRNLQLLPKAHLHLHFSGSMAVPTLVELAEQSGVDIPLDLLDEHPLRVPYDKRGWFQFQRLYDRARRVVINEAVMRRIVTEAAQADASEGSRRLEIQIDPSSYAPFVGGLAAAVEIVLDEARQASRETGVQVGVIIAASRIRHPLDARTLARLAARYSGEVIGFGLSNDEYSGSTEDWEGAFRIARKAGLAGVPHGGELRGPKHVRRIVKALQPTRLGHGIRATEDPATLDWVIEQGIAFEVNPASNVALGVYRNLSDVPLRSLVNAGATVALGADDPLLFLSRLTDQYEIARGLGFSDPELAELARGSIRASLASDDDKARWLGEVDDWLISPDTDLSVTQ